MTQNRIKETKVKLPVRIKQHIILIHGMLLSIFFKVTTRIKLTALKIILVIIIFKNSRNLNRNLTHRTY